MNADEQITAVVFSKQRHGEVVIAKWQPIETAPKDGTEFLAAQHWTFEGRKMWSKYVCWWASDDSGWDDGTDQQRPAPEIWMPIPPIE